VILLTVACERLWVLPADILRSPHFCAAARWSRGPQIHERERACRVHDAAVDCSVCSVSNRLVSSLRFPGSRSARHHRSGTSVEWVPLSTVLCLSSSVGKNSSAAVEFLHSSGV